MGDRLFHTLDPTTRAYEHDGRRYLVTDTVGFIRKLPHQLVEAFKATLEETTLADLIVHVVDASEPDEQRRDHRGGELRPRGDRRRDELSRLLVLNKVDLLDDEDRSHLAISNPGAIPVSAAEGIGLEELRDAIAEAFEETLRPLEVLVPTTTPAIASRSCTRWPAESSARTAPRASRSRRACPRRSRIGSPILR